MILLVDDRPENLVSLKKHLELHRFTIDTADSGEEALRKVLKTDYSVIILDVQMPGMDGFEVANAISGFSRARDTSIIFLSAVNTEKKFITKGYTAGGVDYIVKPADPDILALKLKTLDRLYQQQRELRATQENLRREAEVRQQAQAELARRNQELQTVLQSLPQVAFAVTPDEQLEFVNDHWFRYAPDARTFPACHPDDVPVWEAGRRAIRQGVDFLEEIRLHDRQTDRYGWQLLRLVPICEDGVCVRSIGTFTDIDNQKKAADLLEEQVDRRTRELQLKNTELEQTNHELQQFSWVVSHDLKEPLRKIQLLNDIIRERFLKDNPEATTYLDRSIRSSARMSELIRDLLTYSQLSVPEPFVPTDLNALMQELLLDFDERIARQGAEVVVGNLPTLEAVPTRLRQVFQNLLSNAFKFARPEQPPVICIDAERVTEKAIDAPPSDTGSYYRIRVQDNGIGFDDKFASRIFILFQRLHSATTYEGTGIGLAIAKKNVDRHNGLIAAHSRPGEGATFTLILPICQPS